MRCFDPNINEGNAVPKAEEKVLVTGACREGKTELIRVRTFLCESSAESVGGHGVAGRREVWNRPPG